jgi:hypothetical protein
MDANTLTLADNYFRDGYTVLRGIGCWQGTREKSTGILVAGVSLFQVQAFVKLLKGANRQQTVLVLAWDTECLLL